MGEGLRGKAMEMTVDECTHGCTDILDFWAELWPPTGPVHDTVSQIVGPGGQTPLDQCTSR